MIDIRFDTVFDYKTHRENFTHYLEVVIFKDGHIEYACPGHQMKLIYEYCKENHITRDELNKLIPLYDSPLDWVIERLGIISVWYDFIKRPKEITKEQEETLKRLVDEKCINPLYVQECIYYNEYGTLVSVPTERK